MIIAIDTETKGLDATQYVLGCLIKEGKAKPEIYLNKEDLWKRVLNLAYSEAKRGKNLNVYSHNAQYDTAVYVNLEDPHLIFFSNKPFIWGYKISIRECIEYGIPFTKTDEKREGKEIIKFLDTMAIFKGSLSKIGEMLNYPKMEIPEYLKEGEFNITEAKIKEITPYLIRDTEIVMKSIEWIKKKLKEEEVEIKRLYTINQIAISYLMNQLKKLPREETIGILQDEKIGKTWETYRSEEIHSAYRGGRVEAFKTGVFKKTTEIDFNSRYPWELINLKCPDLKSERKTWQPLENGREINELLNEIGISKAIIYNKENKLGLLSIRTNTENYFPSKNTYMIGTWTHQELREAIKEGYEIIGIEYSITWKEGPNPFKTIMTRLRKKREESKTEMENWFYKSMMNTSIGKMAQHRTDQEMIIDEVDKAQEYLRHNWEIIKGIKNKYMYKREAKKSHKKYYMPIIPTLVNANSRIGMYHDLKKIAEKDLIYHDTDNIIFTGSYKELYKIGDNMGEYKIKKENTESVIYGKKTRSLGDEIIISGFNQKDITIEEFKKGIVKGKEMTTIKTTNNLREVGKFKETKRDLNEQTKNKKNREEEYKNQKLLIDYNINDISYFFKYIENLKIT